MSANATASPTTAARSCSSWGWSSGRSSASPSPAASPGRSRGPTAGRATGTALPEPPLTARRRGDRGAPEPARMRRVERGEDVGADDVVVGHREVVAEVEDALVLEQDVFHVRAGEEGRGVRSDDLVVAGLDHRVF